MKNILTSVLCCLMAISLNGQSAKDMQDVIYLKNGSVIKGIIIEQVPNKTIKIITRDENIFVCDLDEVTKITKETTAKGKKQDSGYFGKVNLLYGVGLGRGDGVNRIGLNVINGYRFNRHLELGGGVGFMNVLKTDEWMLPLFVHLHSNFLKEETTPFISANIGFNLSVMNGKMNGFFFAPELGVLIKGNVTFSVGYQVDRLRYCILYGNGFASIRSLWVGAVNLKLGVTF